MSDSSALDGSGLWPDLGSVMEVNTSSMPGFMCRQEQGFPLPLSMTTANALRYIQIIYYLISFIAASLLNAFVIFIIARFNKLHSITFYLALQLVITDSVNTSIFYPTAITNAITDRFVFKGLCPLMGFLITFLIVARYLLMFVLVVDRFCLIFLPLWYSRHRVMVVILLSIVAWMLAFTITVVPVAGFTECYGFQRISWVCLPGISCTFDRVCSSISFILMTTINTGTCTALLLYLALLCRARKLKNKTTISQSSLNLEDRAIAKRNRKRETQANITFLIMFIVLVGVSLPPYILFNLNSFGSSALQLDSPPPALTIVSVVAKNLISLIFIMDPIIIMRNQEVREVVKNIADKLRGRRERVAGQSSSTVETQPSIVETNTNL